MTPDWTGNPQGQAGVVEERNERYARLVSVDRTVILSSYAQLLEEKYPPGGGSSRFREQAMGEASEVLVDVVRSVLAGEMKIICRLPRGWRADWFRNGSSFSPADWVNAAEVLFNAAVPVLAGHVSDDPDLLPCFTIAVMALNEHITRRIRGVTAYTGFLLNHVREVRTDERRRIARDLHDRLGEQLSLGLRQLDLQEIADLEDSRSETLIVRNVLIDVMHRLRLIASDLREEPLASLEKALVRFLDSLGAEAEVRLRISGDETSVSPLVLDETFLIIREAVRNALTHGAPHLVLIEVDLAPHLLHASVEDDGSGFEPDKKERARFVGTGLTSMHERAACAGGKLVVSSAPGKGTRVELFVSLLRNRCDEQG